MDLRESTISVVVADKTVVLNGEAYVCDVEPDPNVAAIHWTPGEGKQPGRIVMTNGEQRLFGDPFLTTVLGRYLDAWEAAKQQSEDAKAARLAELEAEKRAAEEEEAKAHELFEKEQAELERQQQRFAAFNEAVSGLAGSDHEIIKAMEQMLAEQGRLPAELVDSRRAMRATAKAEKTRLNTSK